MPAVALTKARVCGLLLGLRVRISPGACTPISSECCECCRVEGSALLYMCGVCVYVVCVCIRVSLSVIRFSNNLSTYNEPVEWCQIFK